MLPILLKMRLLTMALAGWAGAAAPLPMPGVAVAAMVAGHGAAPIPVPLYDENEHQQGTIAVWRDGRTDDETAAEVKRLFRCRRTRHEKMIARKTLAMLADVAAHYPGKTIEYVSGFRDFREESRTSPHRGGRAIDFRIRGVRLREIRDYLWKTYTQVGVGWYPSEQFLHLDTRPGLHDTAWTFLEGVNHYHPYWAARARAPVVAARGRIDRRAGS